MGRSGFGTTGLCLRKLVGRGRRIPCKALYVASQFLFVAAPLHLSASYRGLLPAGHHAWLRFAQIICN
eukprot:SAG22_NODE_33_length_27588_cov_104.174652_3_plen_68_part_00